MHVDYCLSINELPPQCIEDCSAIGNVTEAVVSWVKKLNFTVNREKAIRCLGGYGAWDNLEDDTDEELAQRILWLACTNFMEWDGTKDSSSGSNIFCLE